jgi:uncharacterized membrane protein
VVRQSKELEKAYFKATSFVREVTEDTALARLLFGVPGIALILLALGGAHALSLILGLIGAYLILRGFGWEEEFFEHVNDFIRSLSVDRISTLIYFIAFITLFVSLSYAYGDLQGYSITFENPRSTLNAIALIVANGRSITYFLWSLIIAVAARTIDEWSMKKFIQVRRYMILVGFIILVYFIMHAGASFLLEEQYAFGSFVLTSVMGVLIFTLWTQITDLWFRDEIELIKSIWEDFSGMKVYDRDGALIGSVSKVYVQDLSLKGVKVGRKHYYGDDIVSTENVIVVES